MNNLRTSGYLKQNEPQSVPNKINELLIVSVLNPSLPGDLWKHIFGFFDAQELFRLHGINHQFKQTAIATLKSITYCGFLSLSSADCDKI
jgi:hypothetical protein